MRQGGWDVKARGSSTAGILLAMATGLVACQSVEPPGPAVVTNPTLSFLNAEVDRALHALHEARGRLTSEDPRASEALGEAEEALVRMHAYYLPVLEARQRATNAHQLAVRGELTKANDELEHIETILLGVARNGQEEMGREIEEPLDLVEEARVALGRGSPEAGPHLEELAERLELMLLKGDLILH